eukprot:scaffold35353_cov39-Cyclotella_meneghiniana.AAC.3
MISTIVTLFSTACFIASVTAFTASSPKSVLEYKSTTHLNYRNLDEREEWKSYATTTTQTSHRLPSGAFGILPTTSANNEATITDEGSSNNTPLPSNSYATFIETEYLIPPSNGHPTTTNSGCYSSNCNLDLPASSFSVTNKNDNFQTLVEISVGRIAMMAAVVLIGEEVCTGASLPELIAKLVSC